MFIYFDIKLQICNSPFRIRADWVKNNNLDFFADVIRIINWINFAAFDFRRAVCEAKLSNCDQSMQTCNM